ncbi:MAG: hypothetical protein JGK17_06250 [Microcoleus sp. PH2017_10_PVI_O_A]|uniref:hypothetical protein n=1 Tax=unclassified Microcoleus TaxID=2642155 RepID=UPI001DABCA39|nr:MULTISPECIES: hypothetical protein [unclassified Microcoleus]TAE84464.1 MAG: hypothetical protein EAZ83_05770 [Oscillatoriales cyanobacterium]MCC3405188.1 hypothetical protein [Microcoleus sp. PH2017_10_PVI_O_A]MCC3459275.1 hypothetical protein [Microcoleus sp. PH2017_11_PCY_U_A]MCC3477410.1 hypothetical protein [Microcoleus sp. PH2017_12_PCY_D_A]MCC3558503.1 hypothetical protein [Microcoleus sp. PH2017_27_LUM_O_A]
MTNQNWYGMWFWDYLNHDRDIISSDAWEAFDIWKKAYTQEHPDLAGVSDLDLVENHYEDAMEPVFDSWLFKAWRLFYLPSMTLRAIVWRLKLYLIN